MQLPLPGLNLQLGGLSGDPLALPQLLTAICIPACYVLNHLTGNVSWVDRIYTTWPVLCSVLIGSWARGPMIASLPRILLAIGIQLIWSARLTHHSARRGFYKAHMEDYRYPIVRRLVPKWFFEVVVHIIAVVIAQPLLLYALALPIRAMLLPPSELSSGPLPGYHITLNAFAPLRRTAIEHNVPLSTPVLHAGDALSAFLALAAIYLAKRADDAMYTYQEAKHAAMRAKRTNSTQEPETGVPKPVEVPAEFYPGFPTKGLHALVRHPNFAGEQGFWLAQGLLGLGAGPAGTRFGWCLLPPFLLSLLFLSSTTLTEWITTQRYPAYNAYKALVGQFTPMDTVLKYIWTTVRGTRAGLQAQLQPVSKPRRTE